MHTPPALLMHKAWLYAAVIALMGPLCVSCSRRVADTQQEDAQEARLTKLETELSQLKKSSEATSITDVDGPPGGPPDEVVADKLTAWRELFGGQVPTAIKRGDIVHTWGGTLPKETAIFPIKAEFPDGSSHELCFFKDDYREWKSFPKGKADAGFR